MHSGSAQPSVGQRRGAVEKAKPSCCVCCLLKVALVSFCHLETPCQVVSSFDLIWKQFSLYNPKLFPAMKQHRENQHKRETCFKKFNPGEAKKPKHLSLVVAASGCTDSNWGSAYWLMILVVCLSPIISRSGSWGMLNLTIRSMSCSLKQGRWTEDTLQFWFSGWAAEESLGYFIVAQPYSGVLRRVHTSIRDARLSGALQTWPDWAIKIRDCSVWLSNRFEKMSNLTTRTIRLA